MEEQERGKTFQVDSSVNNIGQKAPRKYRGVDAQIKIKNKWGKTELRGEYWWGNTNIFRESIPNSRNYAKLIHIISGISMEHSFTSCRIS